MTDVIDIIGTTQVVVEKYGNGARMEAIMRRQEFSRLIDHITAYTWALIQKVIVELQSRELRVFTKDLG